MAEFRSAACKIKPKQRSSPNLDPLTHRAGKQALGDLVTGTVTADDGRSKLLVQALYERPLMRHLADRAPTLVGCRPGLFALGMPS